MAALVSTEAQILLVVFISVYLCVWVCLNVYMFFLPVTKVLQLSDWLIVLSDWIPVAKMRDISSVIGGQTLDFFSFYLTYYS